MHADSDVLWQPTAAVKAAAPLGEFTRWLAEHRQVDLGSYDELWRWSTDELEAFWESIWAYYRVGTHEPDQVLASRAMPGATWFVGARLNYAEELLKRAAPAGPAIITVTEGESLVEVSRDELRAEAGALAATLKAAGVGRGDRVAAFLPNGRHAVIGLLATASLGAVWTSCSPDFGTQSVIDRFAQVEPKVLLAADGYRFGGREHERLTVLDQLRAALPSVRMTILAAHLHRDAYATDTVTWQAAVAAPAELEYEQVPFEHPLWILFSSGTTGTPKGIVQSHGGIVLEHLKSLALGSGVAAGDRFYFFSSTSWMVWNWLVGGLLVGAIPVLYDGSPGFPDAAGSWRIAARSGAAIFGTGAAYLTASEKAGLSPAADLNLSALRSVISTGSPLPISTARWVAGQFGPTVRIDSSSGGTDVCGGIVSGSPWLPVRAGEISRPCLGVKAEAFDEDGRPVVGAVGELVIREPMPSMPIYFWGDKDGSRYRDAYFDRFPGIWRHGDWIEFTEHGGVIISGRSDATLNKAGVRMGSADIYALVDPLPGVADSMVLGIELPDAGYYMPLFVALEDGHELAAVTEAIRDVIRRDLSPRHLPDEIIAVPAIPRTRTGKKLEIPIKRILQGRGTPADIAAGSVADAAALDWYAAFGRKHVAPRLHRADTPTPVRKALSS